ncbi:MAG: CPBP family intramembrane glutamic endopeptidase, partial [Chloroflexota bacterium]|nr:CPBP family intramembrane glutamic endopeptidase [Chloroflexota bacterium]
FSSFHILFSIGVLVPIFVTGMLLAWLYHRTGSLWPGIAAHAGLNALAVSALILGG